MILRKPYAFLIKNFKLIHLLIWFMMAYLIYRTNLVLAFLQEYIGSSQTATGNDISGVLFNTYMFVLPFIIIIMLFILLGIMIKKKKPFLFYILNIIIFGALIVIYNISYSMVSSLETNVIDIRNVSLVRDFVMLGIIFQGISLILTLIRSVGFDITKFNFVKDLQELEINEVDNEEFEVEVNIETNVIERTIKKTFRFTKYVYVENKFIIDIIFLVGVSALAFLIYMNASVYSVIYKEDETFLTNDFTMGVTSTFVTQEDYKGKDITDNYLVVVQLNIKANYEDLKLNNATAELVIGDKTFFHDNKYRSSLVDLGNAYEWTVIPIDFNRVTLIYEIPKELVNEEMHFKFVDDIETGKSGLNPKYITVKLDPINIDSNKKTKTIKVGKDVVINETILGDTNINISIFDIQKEFTANYNYCIKPDDCYKSTEHLNAKINTNYDKVLLKVSGNLTMDKELNIEGLKTLYNLINYFGEIKYVVNGKTKTIDTNLTAVQFNKIKLTNTYFIEVNSDVLNGDKISFIFSIRNLSYEYIIK